MGEWTSPVLRLERGRRGTRPECSVLGALLSVIHGRSFLWSGNPLPSPAWAVALLHRPQTLSTQFHASLLLLLLFPQPNAFPLSLSLHSLLILQGPTRMPHFPHVASPRAPSASHSLLPACSPSPAPVPPLSLRGCVGTRLCLQEAKGGAYTSWHPIPTGLGTL